ncbi:N-acetylglucosamine kinase [Pseudonocardia sp. MH-G8]|uniref:N-acetylglucosamine kinase n=1 Tax=Pseudonocardia sp. MH-G8 TaxID=1854588 RepID=UPI000BA0FFE6|nr:BadF/BadG/BcrA/BcrD ATPase family protein [Pseudonocardia sp. MH-G8]OZM76034.1 ATPase [Pseudonocardia sp. MH-G8]
MRSVIGLDIGGSKTHGIRATDGTTVAEAVAGSANLAAVGPVEAGRQLDAVLAGLGTDEVDAVCAGAAGADGAESVATMVRLLRDRVPGAAVSVVHDARLVLAAADLDAGVALIAGTGSVAWGARADGATARAGGWGHLLGDEGSGYRVALDAVRHCLDRMDAGRPVDALGAALLDGIGLAGPHQLIDFVYTRQDRRYWAEQARVVTAVAGQGDTAARTILDAAADALTALAVRVLERLDRPGPVVLGGGFAVHEPLVQDAVRERLAGTEVRALAEPPAAGAVRLAAALPRPDLESLR